VNASAAGLAAELESGLDRLATSVTALAEVNSGSFNVEGVDRCGARLAAMLDELGPDRIDQVAVGPTPVMGDTGTVEHRPVGRAVVATMRPEAPFQVLLFGHLDTVYPADSPFQRVRREGHTLHGPGVADCKGGLVVAIEAVRFLDRTDWGGDIGWRFVAVPDEEVGSVGSKSWLADLASGCHLGLGFEPALPGGGVAAGRKGSLTAHLGVHGRSAHVGRAHGQGRSAIRALARLVDRLEAENATHGVTVNCGRISGGGALNAVPDLAIGSFNVRVESAADHRWIERVFAEVVQAASTDGVEAAVHWTSARPPKERNRALDALLADVIGAGSALGQTIAGEDTGGSCDGNDLAAAGLVNIDSLGIGGGAIHSPDEFALLDTLPGRSALVVEVLRRRLTGVGGIR
jgi:glutamate carboxypeptidase